MSPGARSWLAWGLSLALMALGCADAAAPSGAPSSEAAAWVAALRDAHQEADDAEARGDVASARAALTTLASQPAPAGVASPHARAARHDLYFRLATLAASAGDHEGARAAAAAGLALGQGEDVLSANLLIAHGEASEVLGDTARARADYMAALRINEALLDAVLDEEGSP